MTPQERQQVTELFDRLATLEGNRRDPEAEAQIAEGTRQAPHSLYALVQTTLIQDEALREADARIRELEGGQAGAPGQGGFLDNARDWIEPTYILFGRFGSTIIELTGVLSGTTFTRSHVFPSSRLTITPELAVPIQIVPGTSGDE